jgi:hypothetical protein
MTSTNSTTNKLMHEDYFHFDLQQLDVSHPRDIRMILSNENPLSISLRVNTSTDPVCICREVAWPIGRHEKRRGLEFLNNMTGISYSMARTLPAKCACLPSSTTSSSVVLATTDRPQQQNETFDDNRIVLKPGYHTLVSINFDMFRHQQPPQEKDGTIQESSLQLQSLFQKFSFDFHYKVISKSLDISPLPSNEDDDDHKSKMSSSAYVLGMNQGIQFQLKQREESTNAAAVVSKGGVVSTKLYPSFSFLQPGTSPNLDRVFVKISSKSQNNDQEYIFGVRMWLCLLSVLKDMKSVTGGEKKSAIPNANNAALLDLQEYLEEFKRDNNKYIPLTEVYFKFLQLKRLFFKHFPTGLALPNSTLIVRTMNALQYHPLLPTTPISTGTEASSSPPPPTLQLPLSMLSNAHELSITLSSTQPCSIFLEVFNPFDFEVDYILLEEQEFPSFPSTTTSTSSSSKPHFKVISNPEDSYRACSSDGITSIRLVDEEEDEKQQQQPQRKTRRSKNSVLLDRVSKLENISHHYLDYNYTRTIYETAIIRIYPAASPSSSPPFVHKANDSSSSSSPPPPSHCSMKGFFQENEDKIRSRSKNVVWRVKPEKRMMIGPIDFSTKELQSRIYSKLFFLGNSFLGYDQLNITFRTIQPILNVLSTSICRQSVVTEQQECSKISSAKINNEKSAIILPFSSPHDEVSLQLTSNYTMLTVSTVLFNNISCWDFYSSPKAQRMNLSPEKYCGLQLPIYINPRKDASFQFKPVYDCTLKTEKMKVSFVEMTTGEQQSIHSIVLEEIIFEIHYQDEMLVQCLQGNHVKRYWLISLYLLMIFMGSSYYFFDSFLSFLEAISSSSSLSPTAVPPPNVDTNASGLQLIHKTVRRNLKPLLSKLKFKEVDLDDLKTPPRSEGQPVMTIGSILEKRQSNLLEQHADLFTAATTATAAGGDRNGSVPQVKKPFVPSSPTRASNTQQQGLHVQKDVEIVNDESEEEVDEEEEEVEEEEESVVSLESSPPLSTSEDEEEEEEKEEEEEDQEEQQEEKEEVKEVVEERKIEDEEEDEDEDETDFLDNIHTRQVMSESIEEELLQIDAKDELNVSSSMPLNTLSSEIIHNSSVSTATEEHKGVSTTTTTAATTTHHNKSWTAYEINPAPVSPPQHHRMETFFPLPQTTTSSVTHSSPPHRHQPPSVTTKTASSSVAAHSNSFSFLSAPPGLPQVSPVSNKRNPPPPAAVPATRTTAGPSSSLGEFTNPFSFHNVISPTNDIHHHHLSPNGQFPQQQLPLLFQLDQATGYHLWDDIGHHQRQESRYNFKQQPTTNQTPGGYLPDDILADSDDQNILENINELLDDAVSLDGMDSEQSHWKQMNTPAFGHHQQQPSKNQTKNKDFQSSFFGPQSFFGTTKNSNLEMALEDEED